MAVAARRLLQDPNDEPQYGERIPYVIIRGEPNTRLVDRAVGPGELLDDRYVTVWLNVNLILFTYSRWYLQSQTS